MPTVNESLQDKMIRHSVYVERFKAYEVAKMLKIIKSADMDLQSELGKYSGVDNWTKRRQEQLLASLKELESDNGQKFAEGLTNDLREFGQSEASWLTKQIGGEIDGFGLSVAAPSGAQVWSAANADFMLLEGGVSIKLKEYMDRMFPGRWETIQGTLRNGFVTGKTSQEIARQLIGSQRMNYGDGNLQKNRNWTNTLVRTAMNHMASTAREKTFTDNDDLIKGYEWVSTLDARTTDICQLRDGKVWIYDNPAESTLEGPYQPPAHYGCRSTTTPILKSWRDLGLDIDEFPESTRASLDGQVPESLTYLKWLEKQSSEVQIDVLGVTRYNLWKSGEYTIQQFYSDGRMMTLAELNQRG
jgi:SPP1 gp7 family putative phage head morphogenesis protein